MTTDELSAEKRKLAAKLVEVIWDSPLYKEGRVDIDIACVKLSPAPNHSHLGLRDKIVDVDVTVKII